MAAIAGVLLIIALIAGIFIVCWFMKRKRQKRYEGEKQPIRDLPVCGFLQFVHYRIQYPSFRAFEIGGKLFDFDDFLRKAHISFMRFEPESHTEIVEVKSCPPNSKDWKDESMAPTVIRLNKPRGL